MSYIKDSVGEMACGSYASMQRLAEQCQCGCSGKAVRLVAERGIYNIEPYIDTTLVFSKEFIVLLKRFKPTIKIAEICRHTSK